MGLQSCYCQCENATYDKPNDQVLGCVDGWHCGISRNRCYMRKGRH